jgi:rhodanese-related sulfurtransferase
MDMHFDGVIFQTHAAELARRLRHPFPPFAVLDLRGEEEWAAGHIPGARPASLEALERGLPQGTTPETEFFLVGSGPSDPAPRAASLALKRLGARRRVELPGGMHEWQAQGLPTERPEPA